MKFLQNHCNSFSRKNLWRLAFIPESHLPIRPPLQGDAMDGDPFGTEARDDQGDLATDARPAPLLCLDRGGTTARRSGVNAVRVSSRQSAGDGTRRDDRRPTTRVARRHGTAAPVRPAAGAGIRPASAPGLCPPTDFTGLVPPLGTRRGKPRGGGAGTDRKSTRLNSSHIPLSRMPSSA